MAAALRYRKNHPPLENLQVSTDNPLQLNRVLQAALKAGATSVNTSPSFPPSGMEKPTLPTPEALSTAVNQATIQAKALAQASALAAGVTLGNLRRVVIQPLLGFPTPNSNVWRVQVNVTYDIAK